MGETKVGSIGVPTTRGMTAAFGDFAWGAAGGLIYALSRAILGSGLVGALAAPVLAGSVIKGVRGTTLATVAGFMLLAGMGASAAQAAPAQEVM